MKPALLLLFTLFTTAAWSAQTVTQLEPVSDTYIRSQDPTKNFGGEPKLEIAGANDHIALFRFDLSKIPPSAVVQSVHLTLTFDVPSDQAMESKFLLCDLNRDFQETEATYRDFAKGKPWGAPGLVRYSDYAASDSYYCAAPVHLSNPGPVQVDVTTYIRMALSTHRPAANFALLSTSDSYMAGTVFSRRAPDPATHPKLAIAYDPSVPRAVTNHPFTETKFAPITVDASESSKPDGSKAGLTYLWTVDQPAPASSYSQGQELGHEVKLKFEPDVPGGWNFRLRVTDPATKGFSETTVSISDFKLGAHPRMGFNGEFLGQLKSLRSGNRPEWARFDAWLAHPTEPGFGHTAQALMLGYVVTKKKAYFDTAWKTYGPYLYVNGIDRTKGLRPFMGTCPQAVYCEDHAAGFAGGSLIIEMASFYDWGFDALLPTQRKDLIEWLNTACEFNELHNSYAHTHFRNEGAITVGALGAVAYATWEENPQATALMSSFRREWGHTLEVLDILGKGGALGSGNAYDEATAASLINIANFVYYATGENLFYSHPYFRRHLAYTAFSTYPNRLGEADDPISHTTPAHPVPEGASLNGDDNRGFSWHTVHMRPNGLALARRFPNTEEAGIFNWVFRQKDVDLPFDPWADIFFYAPPPALVKPKRLSFFDPGLGYVYVRSDWDGRDATWISSWAGAHVDTHQHLDQGSFTIFKRRDLAPKTGSYDSDVVKPHFMSYYTRTVSDNNLLIGDPNEYFSSFVGYSGCDGLKKHDLFPAPDGGAKVCIPNDGGQRTMAPYSLGIFGTDDFVSRRDVYDVAKVTSFADNGQAVVWVADLTNAYNNARHTTPNNKPKVTKVYRKFVYLRQPDILLVADTVDSTNPDFEKSWLIHAVDHIEVGGTVKKVDDGESIHTETDRARIVVDDKSPSNLGEVTADLRTGYAALQLKTLFPNNFRYDLIGGREASSASHMEQFQTDPKVLQGGVKGDHMHRHFKDFWVKDYSEGVQPDHRSQNWAPVSPQEVAYAQKGPTFVGGYGRWRLEIQPTTPSKNDYFLNVLKPTLETTDNMPDVKKFETADTFGAAFTSGDKTYKVTFTKETLAPPAIEGMDLAPPVISSPKPTSQLPANTRQATVSVTTDEPASCRFAYREGVAYPFMSTSFQSADGLTHTTVNRELNNGDTYTYFVRCVDKSGNENLEDFRLGFSVAH
jgi:hypothetical protein